MTSLEERFWAKVDRRGPDDCWPWTGGKISTGYGECWDGARVVLAHRRCRACTNLRARLYRSRT